MLQRAGLVEHVDFWVGDARAVAADLDTDLDFVLLDIGTHAYVQVFDVLSEASFGAFLVADNMLAPPSPEAAVYRAHVRRMPDIESVLLPIGQGLELSRCTQLS